MGCKCIYLDDKKGAGKFYWILKTSTLTRKSTRHYLLLWKVNLFQFADLLYMCSTYLSHLLFITFCSSSSKYSTLKKPILLRWQRQAHGMSLGRYEKHKVNDMASISKRAQWIYIYIFLYSYQLSYDRWQRKMLLKFTHFTHKHIPWQLVVDVQ